MQLVFIKKLLTPCLKLELLEVNSTCQQMNYQKTMLKSVCEYSSSLK